MFTTSRYKYNLKSYFKDTMLFTDNEIESNIFDKRCKRLIFVIGFLNT